MVNYLIQRLLIVPVTLVLVSFLVFSLSRMIPGDVIDIMYEMYHDKSAAKDKEALREKLGLNKPVFTQYAIWASKIIKGNWGESLWSGQSVLKEIGKRWPVTLELGLFALAISLALALPIGIISAIRQDSSADYLLRSYSIAILSIPSFWLAMLIILIPTIWFPNWRGAPAYVHFSTAPLANIKMMIIPAFCLGAALSGSTMRITRTMMLEVLRQDYIRTAWAKGLQERVVIIRHALKNAMIPVVTMIGTQLISLIGGSVLIEQIFGLPGIGQYMFSSILARDYPVISGINLVLASTVVFLNLFVDMTYAYLDPRIRHR